MDKIFLIAGMGADTRLFNNIDLPAKYDVVPVDWIEPEKTDTLVTYAQKLIYKYDIRPNDIVIGNSMGGILAVEIAKVVKLKKVILISSIKTSAEEPPLFNIGRKFPIYKLIPGRVMTSLGFIVRPMLGKVINSDGWLFGDMLEHTSPVFLKWALGAILKWHNDIIPPNLYHITGNKDRIFNYELIKDATIIDGGTHLMIIDYAKEINKILKRILK